MSNTPIERRVEVGRRDTVLVEADQKKEIVPKGDQEGVGEGKHEKEQEEGEIEAVGEREEKRTQEEQEEMEGERRLRFKEQVELPQSERQILDSILFVKEEFLFGEEDEREGEEEERGEISESQEETKEKRGVETREFKRRGQRGLKVSGGSHRNYRRSISLGN